MGKLEKESLNVIVCSISCVSAKWFGQGRMKCTYGTLKALPGMQIEVWSLFQNEKLTQPPSQQQKKHVSLNDQVSPEIFTSSQLQRNFLQADFQLLLGIKASDLNSLLMLNFPIRMSARFPLLAEKYLSKTLAISQLTEETNL